MSQRRAAPAGRARRTGAMAAAVAALLGACTTAEQAAEEAGGNDEGCPVAVNEDVTATAQIAYQPIPNGDLVVLDQGWLEACLPNAAIEWNQFTSGAEVVQAFGSGTIDLGLAGSSPAVTMMSPPLNVAAQVVWIHDVIGEAESLVARGGAESVEELAGATIAVPYGSTAHLSLLRALSDAGLAPGEDVTLINLSPDAMLGAWEREEIDAAWVWHPTLEVLLEIGTIVLSSEDTAAAGAPTYDLAAATTAFIESNPEFMVTWTELQHRAVQLIADEPELAAESVGAQLGIEPAEAAQQMAGYVYLDAVEQAGAQYFGGGLADDLVLTADFLVEQQEIPEAAAPDDYAQAVYGDAIMTVVE